MSSISSLLHHRALFWVGLLAVVGGLGIWVRSGSPAGASLPPCAEPRRVGAWLTCDDGSGDAGMAASGSPREWLIGRPLDVNLASAQELAEVPGIGAGTAGAIVAHRERLGPFASLDELLAVRGIGERTLARARPFLRVRNAAPRPRVSSP